MYHYHCFHLIWRRSTEAHLQILKKVNQQTLFQLLIHALAIGIFSNFSALASSLFSQFSLLSTLILRTSEIRSLQNLINLTSSFSLTEYWNLSSSVFSSPRSLSEMERLHERVNVFYSFLFSPVSIFWGKSLFLWYVIGQEYHSWVINGSWCKSLVKITDVNIVVTELLCNQNTISHFIGPGNS